MASNNERNSSNDFQDLFDINGGIASVPLYIIIYVVVFGFASFVGTLGNLLVIITIMVTRALRQTRNAFIVSLAVADLMVSSVTMPASITGVLLGKHWYDQRSALCALTSTVCAPGCVASMHSIAWIAVSRYYYIAKYPKYMVYFTRQRIAIYISCIWLLGFVVHLPNHFGWGQTRYSFMLRYCSLDTDLHSYALFYSAVLLAAIVAAFVFYFRIYLVLRKSTLSKTMIVGRKQENGQNNNNNQHHHQSLTDEIKIVKTSFKIFVLFLITWSPLCVLFLINIGDKVPAWLYLYSALSAHGNSTLNFIVYFMENDMFRKALKSLVYKALGKQNSVNASVAPGSRTLPMATRGQGPVQVIQVREVSHK